MIGGTDVVLRVADAPRAVALLVSEATREWQHAVVVRDGADTFVYRSEADRRAWEDRGAAAGIVDTMIYAVAEVGAVTFVVAPGDSETRKIADRVAALAAKL